MVAYSWSFRYDCFASPLTSPNPEQFIHLVAPCEYVVALPRPASIDHSDCRLKRQVAVLCRPSRGPHQLRPVIPHVVDFGIRGVHLHLLRLEWPQ